MADRDPPLPGSPFRWGARGALPRRAAACGRRDACAQLRPPAVRRHAQRRIVDAQPGSARASIEPVAVGRRILRRLHRAPVRACAGSRTRCIETDHPCRCRKTRGGGKRIARDGLKRCRHPALAGPQPAPRGKNSCANRRNRACATRNPRPFRKVFFSCRSTLEAPPTGWANSMSNTSARVPVDNPRKKNTRFPDVFLHALLAGMQSRVAGAWSMGAGRAVPRVPPRRPPQKKVTRKC